MWIICLVLTLTDALEPGHPARTDARVQVLTDSAWFYVPYPLQFGTPTVSIAGMRLRMNDPSLPALFGTKIEAYEH